MFASFFFQYIYLIMVQQVHCLSGYWICIYSIRTQMINSKCCGMESFNVWSYVRHLWSSTPQCSSSNSPYSWSSESNHINFWNSTYGEQIMLDFPQNLFPVLDKLYSSGKIKLCNITCHMEDGINRLQRSLVITTLNKCSKRVENIGKPTYGFW